MTLKEFKEIAEKRVEERNVSDRVTTDLGEGTHIIHLMDPVTGDVQRRRMGSDWHLGAVED